MGLKGSIQVIPFEAKHFLCFVGKSSPLVLLNILRGIDPMVRIFNLEALLVHQANKTCLRSYATIARSRVI